jgi:hypothetical protein
MADTWQTIEQAAVSLRLSVRMVNRHIVAGKLQSRLTPEGRREVLVSLPEVPAEVAPAPSHFDAAVTGADDAVTDTWRPAEQGAQPVMEVGSTSMLEDGHLTGTATISPAAATNGAPVASATSEATASQSRPASPAGSPFSQSTSPAVTVDPETVLALADNAAAKAEMAVAAYQALARVTDQQSRQVRRNARMAWISVAAMAAIVTGAVGYTSYRWTRMTVESDTRLTRAESDLAHLSSQLKQGTQTIDRLTGERETLRTQLLAGQEALRTQLGGERDERARAEGRLAAYKEQEEARKVRDAEVLAAAARLEAAAKLEAARIEAAKADVAKPDTSSATAARGADRNAPADGAPVAQQASARIAGSSITNAPTTAPSDAAADEARLAAVFGKSGATSRPAPVASAANPATGAFRRKVRPTTPSTHPAPSTASESSSASTADDRESR